MRVREEIAEILAGRKSSVHLRMYETWYIY